MITEHLIVKHLEEKRRLNIITSFNTERSYQTKLRHWLEFSKGNDTIEKARGYVDKLKEGYGSTIIGNWLYVLSSYYDYTDQGYNPFRKLARQFRKDVKEIEGKKIQRDEKVLTQEDVDSMLQVSYGLCHGLHGMAHFLAYRNYFMIYMLSEFGMRVEGLIKMDVKHIDFQNRKAVIWASKNKKPYPIPIFHVEDEIRRYLGVRSRHFENHTPLFLSRSGIRLTEDAARRAINAIAKKADLYEPGRSTHQLRHYRATTYHKEGMRHELISLIMGMTVEVLRKTYLHLSHKDIIKEYEEWHNQTGDSWVCPKCGFSKKRVPKLYVAGEKK